MLDKVQPGDELKITVSKAPRAESSRKTIARLMRQDPEINSLLRGAQKQRKRTLVVRSRGKRPWAVRRRCARYARVIDGASWNMQYVPHLDSDLRSVSKFLDIAKA